MPTTRFNLPYIAADQAQKHVTHNAALDLLDALLPRAVASASTATAPAAPAEGEAHIVPAGASGYGGAAPGDLAIFTGGTWAAIAPQFGWSVPVLDEGRARVFAGAAGWLPGRVAGAATGAALGLAVADAVLTASGASVTATGLIPARCILLGVTSWTIAAVTGAASYDVGDGVTVGRFGGTLGIAQGASNVGVIGPSATYAPTDVVVTANGGAFTGGEIGVAALLIEPSGAPL